MKIIGVIFALLTAGNAVAFGAVASSEHESGVAIGLSANQDSVHSARKAAIEQCKAAEGTNCIIAAEFTDTCAAIAVGNDKNGEPVGSFATNEDEADAIKDAIATCQEDGGKCEEHSSGCDGDPFVVHEEFADLTIPQICSQLCGDITEQRDITGELTLAPVVQIPESADSCITPAVGVREKTDCGEYFSDANGIVQGDSYCDSEHESQSFKYLFIRNNCDFIVSIYGESSGKFIRGDGDNSDYGPRLKVYDISEQDDHFAIDIERKYSRIYFTGSKKLGSRKKLEDKSIHNHKFDGYCFRDDVIKNAGLSVNPDPCPKEDSY